MRTSYPIGAFSSILYPAHAFVVKRLSSRVTSAMLRRARSLVKGRLPAARRSYSSGDESARRPQLDTEVFERFPPRQDVVVSAIDNRTIEQTRKLPPVSMGG